MGNQIVKLVSGKGRKSASKKSKSSKAAAKKQRALEEELIERQVLAFALQQQQKSIRLERAASQRNNPSLNGGVPEKLPRSASSRPRHITDPVVQPHQLINGNLSAGVSDTLESKHIVLVHGAGNGAWCWYKSIALLEEAGFTTTAVDLTGSGIDHTDPNTVTTLAHYVKPLLDLLEKLSVNEKVVLVGHDFGGACISYAMEMFPEKVSKAVFVTAAMVASGQRASDIFAPELMTADDLLPKAQRFVYANNSSSCTSTVPTALEFDKDLVKDLLFNQSPAKDVALAAVSMRPLPFAPTVERITLTPEKYGSVPRYFIQTAEDRALTPALQEKLVSDNPPEKTFQLKGSDHSPFFSKPQSLHRLLLEIAHLQKPSSSSSQTTEQKSS